MDLRKLEDSIQYYSSQLQVSKQIERDLIARRQSAEVTSKRIENVLELLNKLSEIGIIVNDPAETAESACEKIRSILG